MPFDAGRLRVTGEAIHLADGVSTPGFGVAQLAVAENGTVAYIPAEARSLVLVDRQGTSRLATPERRNFHAPTLSPDGRRIATDFASDDGRDIWTLDLTDGRLTRMTFERDGHDPTWALDGTSLTFLSSHGGGGTLGLYRTHPGRPDAPDTLLISAQLGWTGSWLRDGSAIVTAVSALRPETRGDIGPHRQWWPRINRATCLNAIRGAAPRSLSGRPLARLHLGPVQT